MAKYNNATQNHPATAIKCPHCENMVPWHGNHENVKVLNKHNFKKEECVGSGANYGTVLEHWLRQD